MISRSAWTPFFALAAVLATLGSATSQRRLIVQLEDPPLSLSRSSRTSAARVIQDRFLYTAKRNGGLELAEMLTETGELREARFSTVLNAVSVIVPDGVDDVQGAVGRVRSQRGVVGVWQDRMHHETLFAAEPQVSAPAAWTSLLPENPGKGIKIAIIDGGTLCNVSMMSGVGFDWPSDIPSPGRGEKENCNAKLVVSKAFFNPADPPHDTDSHSWPGPLKNSHGVHTSSSAAGVPVMIHANSTLTRISGVAPYAWVMNYRVFYINASGESVGRSVEILAALEDAVADGANVISNSWADTPFEDGSSIISTFAKKASIENGVVFVFAAGNSGSNGYLSSMDHPESTSIRVAAVTSTKLSTIGVETTPAWQTVAPTLAPPAKTLVGVSTTSTAATLPIAVPVTADASTLGCSTMVGNYSGKALVMSTSGACSNEIKANMSAAAGAVMLVLVNTKDTPASITIQHPSISVISIGKSYGAAFATLVASYPNATLQIEPVAYTSSTFYPDVVSDFSSRGPTTELTMGPDVSAPGYQIIAAGFGQGVGSQVHYGYGSVSGTSMACPQVAGAAALILQANPKFTPAEVKSALMTTSVMAVYTTQNRANQATALDTGAGRIDVFKALHPSLFLDPPSISFSLVPVNITSVFTVTVKAYKQMQNLSLAIRSLKGTFFATGSYFNVTPSFIDSIDSGSVISVNITIKSNNTGDHFAHLVISNGTELVAHAPIWARVKFSQSADVFLVDLDGSTCYNTTDLAGIYQSAFESVGLTTRTYDHACKTTFTYPGEALYGNYKAVVIFVGSETYANMPYLGLLLGDSTSLTNMGTALITMGSQLPDLWGVTNGGLTLSVLCGASFQSETTNVAKIRAHESAPRIFNFSATSLSSAVSLSEIYYHGLYREVPLFANEGSSRDFVLSKAFVHQEYPDEPSFHSACALSSLGLEDIPSQMRGNFTWNLFNLLIQKAPKNYTVIGVSFNQSKLSLNVSILDTEFEVLEFMVIWGDGAKEIASYSPGSVIEHQYTEYGSFSPYVMVKSSVGRVFKLAHSVSVMIPQPTASSSVPNSQFSSFDQSSVKSSASFSSAVSTGMDSSFASETPSSRGDAPSSLSDEEGSTSSATAPISSEIVAVSSLKTSDIQPGSSSSVVASTSFFIALGVVALCL